MRGLVWELKGARVVTTLLAIATLIPVGSRYAWGSSKERLRGELEKVESALAAGGWVLALERADWLIEAMAKGDTRGEGSRSVYGFAFAFRAIAAEELGRHNEAIWDWGCARMLSELAVAPGFEEFGDAARRIRERESEAASSAPTVAELAAQTGEEVVSPVRQVWASLPTFPGGRRPKRALVSLEIHFRIGLRGEILAPRAESDEQVSDETAYYAAALASMRRLRYEPARVRGRPVEVDSEIAFNFKKQ